MRPLVALLFTTAPLFAATLLKPGTYPKSELPRKTKDPWLCLVDGEEAKLTPCAVTGTASSDGLSIALSADVPAAFLFRGLPDLAGGPVPKKIPAPEVRSLGLPERPEKPKVAWSGDLNRDGRADAIVDIGSPYRSATWQIALSDNDKGYRLLIPSPIEQLATETRDTVRALVFRDSSPPYPSNEETSFGWDQYFSWAPLWVPENEKVLLSVPGSRGGASKTSARVRPVHHHGGTIEAEPILLVQRMALPDGQLFSPEAPTAPDMASCLSGLSPEECATAARKHYGPLPPIAMFAVGPFGIKRLPPAPIRLEVEPRGSDKFELHRRARPKLPAGTVLVFRGNPIQTDGNWTKADFAPLRGTLPPKLPPRVIEMFGTVALASARWWFLEKENELPALVRVPTLTRRFDNNHPYLAVETLEFVLTQDLIENVHAVASIDVDGDGKREIVLEDGSIAYVDGARIAIDAAPHEPLDGDGC